VKIAVRFWRKTGLNSTSVLAFCKVFLNQLLYEANAFLLFVVFFFNCHHVYTLFILYCKGNGNGWKSKGKTYFFL